MLVNEGENISDTLALSRRKNMKENNNYFKGPKAIENHCQQYVHSFARFFFDKKSRLFLIKLFEHQDTELQASDSLLECRQQIQLSLPHGL